MLILFRLFSVKSSMKALNANFPDDLKLTDISPVYKKNNRYDTLN